MVAVVLLMLSYVDVWLSEIAPYTLSSGFYRIMCIVSVGRFGVVVFAFSGYCCCVAVLRESNCLVFASVCLEQRVSCFSGDVAVVLFGAPCALGW